MNIKEAKEQIKNAITAYFTKDEFGKYIIPIERQRPVFLMGPPGIGKTAIMEQIAEELGVGLVSYSMTHHTRQSALGLPFIVTKTYGGKEYDVSEYTMSEIISSVYDAIEEGGAEEGILFLDEINCVSETLAPAMLQFLQYKIFGRHRVPEGWIVVTAGNPPEFNNSVREFDIVTEDRMKRINIEPDYEVWKEYAYKKGVHPAITTYLDIKRNDFYVIETTVDGKCFVTARGWGDLSDMIYLYEKNEIGVDQKLVEQYVQNPKIAREFAIYYDLYNKYKSDYQVEDILAGNATDEIKQRAKNAKFDERLTLLGIMLDTASGYVQKVNNQELTLTEYMNCLKTIYAEIRQGEEDVIALLDKHAEEYRAEITRKRKAGSLSHEDQYKMLAVISALEESKKALMFEQLNDGEAAYELLRMDFGMRVADMKKSAAAAEGGLNSMFEFAEEVFGEGQEILILVTELTANYHAAKFISRHGCDAYFRHNKELLFYERQKEIIAEIEELNL